MPPLDPELVRHALTVARSHGYAEVELDSAEGSFHAVLEPKKRARPAPSSGSLEMAAISVEPEAKPIKATLVGYVESISLKAGDEIRVGQRVAVVTALGLANDIESSASGIVETVLVSPGEPVQYGQPIAMVKAE